MGASSSWAQAVRKPEIAIVHPADHAVLHDSKATVSVSVKNFRVGYDGVVCLDVIWDKGKTANCFTKVEDWVLDGLESDTYAVLTSLKRENGDIVAQVRVLDSRRCRHAPRD